MNKKGPRKDANRQPYQPEFDTADSGKFDHSHKDTDLERHSAPAPASEKLKHFDVDVRQQPQFGDVSDLLRLLRNPEKGDIDSILLPEDTKGYEEMPSVKFPDGFNPEDIIGKNGKIKNSMFMAMLGNKMAEGYDIKFKKEKRKYTEEDEEEEEEMMPKKDNYKVYLKKKDA